MMRRMAAIALTLALLSFTGCVNPKTLPGIRGYVKREDERITKATEEAVKKSPLLQDLDHLCTKEISVPDDFVLVSRDMGTTSTPATQTFLGYGYSSRSDYQQVKKFYKDRLLPKGWQLITEKDAGGDEANYSLQCGRLSSATEAG
jgi:hypothetical protein